MYGVSQNIHFQISIFAPNTRFNLSPGVGEKKEREIEISHIMG